MLKKLWDLLFHPCKHKWNIIQAVIIHEAGYELPVGQKLIMQCEHCGDVKSKRI